MKYLLQIMVLCVMALPFSAQAGWDFDICDYMPQMCEKPKLPPMTEIDKCKIMPWLCDNPQPPMCEWGYDGDDCKEPPCKEDCEPPVSVPEPAVFGLLAVGLAGLGLSRRKK